MNIFTYFKRLGVSTVSSDFYAKIGIWESWYYGFVKNVHEYKIYNGQNSVRRRRRSLQMAKKVCEDMADFLVNEKVGVTIADENTNEYVKSILENNKFWVKANEFQERKSATGTVAYVCQLKDMVITENGDIISGSVEIDYVQAKNIFPITWDAKAVKECAFVYPKTVQGKEYAVIQFHMILDSQYVITNHVVRCTQGAGTELDPSEWGNYAEFSTLAREVKTGTDKPLFVIDRLNIVNNVADDDTCPLGISLYANSMDTLGKMDIEYDSYENEFSLGRKRIFVAPEMITGVDGNPVFDSNDTVFYSLPEDMKTEGKPITELNMTIRGSEHTQAINDDLKWLSLKIGFGTERYKFERGSIQTATQVISEDSDLYRTIKKHEVILEDVLKELIRIIIRLGIACNTPGLVEDVEIKIDFDDSIIEDKTTERKNDREDVAIGVMGLAEYRAKWYNETPEDAAKNLPAQTEAVLP